MPTGFHVPRGTRVAESPHPVTFRLRGAYPLWPAFPCRSTRCLPAASGLPPRPLDSHNPGPATPAGFCTDPVWALPRSLAATRGISVDLLSSRYWDVSVPALCLLAAYVFSDR